MERELRHARPTPPSSLVRAIAERTGAPRSERNHRRARIGVAVAVLTLTAAAVGASGGFSEAATSIASVTRSVAHTGTRVEVTPLQSQPTFVSGSPTHFDSACDMYAQAPTISDDDLGVAAPGSTVTVTGTNFTGINEITNVQVGDEDASFRVDSSESLELSVPDDASSGNTTVTVSNCAGTSNSAPLTVEAAPSITNVDPSTAGYGAEVTITGTGFLGTTKVTFNGRADSTFSVDDSGTTITAHVPSGAPAKAGSVEVTNGVDSASTDFTVESGAPTISTITPASGQVGQDGSITIKGSHFEDSTGASLVTHVYFSGSDDPVSEPFHVVSASEVDADSVPTGAITGPITVETSVGAATSKQDFTVVGTTPVVSGFDPPYARVNTTIKLEGSSLTGVTGVAFTDSDGNQTVAGTAVRALGDSVVSVKVPSAAETGLVKVTRDNGQSGLSSVPFTVIGEAPDLASVSPSSGGYGTSVTIAAEDGHTLTGVTAVAFNGKKDTSFTISDDGSTITATVPARTPAKPAGQGRISVTNAKGTSTIPFDVISDGPTVSQIFGTLGNGSEAEVGDPVTILGTNLDTVTEVDFGGNKTATSFVWQDPNLLAVRVPAGADSGRITVVNPDGTATSSSSLTVLHQPSVVTFSPAFGRSGTPVKIVGDGFSGASGVYFGGAPAKFKLVDDNTITATVPSNAASGSVEVVVGRVMSADSGSDQFTVVATRPTVSDFSTDHGDAGTSVTITGHQFIGPVTVKFGSKEASFVHVASSTSLTAKVPDGASGTVAVSVTNLAGTGSKSGFRVVSLQHATPATGVRDETKVTLTGTNLTAGGAPTVKVGGVSATVLSAASSRVVARVPSTASTGAITLTTGSTTVSSPTTFTVILAPSIRSYPSSARVGAWVDIYGSGFTGLNAVKFNATSARFQIDSDGHIEVRVPRTGSVRLTVRNAAGSATTAGTFVGVR